MLGVLQQVSGISHVDEGDGDRLDVVVDDLTQPTRSADFRSKPVHHLNKIIDELCHWCRFWGGRPLTMMLRLRAFFDRISP